MKRNTTLKHLAIILFCLNLTILLAGEKKDCSKALKGVVNLKNNDVRFQTKEGATVFVDPLSGPEDSNVIQAKMTSADLILITHPHGDHFKPDVLKAYQKNNPDVIIAGPADVAKLAKDAGIKMKTVEPNQKYKLAGIKLKTMPAYFKNRDHHPKEKGWVGYVLYLNGNSYYITGDTESIPEMADTNVDVLFPLLFGCGANIDQAIKMIKVTQAQLIVPVHFGGQEETVKKLLAKLPEGVHCNYFLKGKMITP